MQREQGRQIDLAPLLASRPQRHYPENGLLAHVLGYVGEISPRQLELTEYKSKGFKPGDVIGKEGLRITTKKGRAEYATLIKDPDTPLYNRAIRGRYPPGSTWKIPMAIAGLQQGVVTFDSARSSSKRFDWH